MIGQAERLNVNHGFNNTSESCLSCVKGKRLFAIKMRMR